MNVFSAAIDAGYWVLALIGVLASVAAAFFYLRVIVLMYMQEPETAPSMAAGSGATNSPAMGAILAVPAVATLVLGVFPGVIVGIIEEASVLRW